MADPRVCSRVTPLESLFHYRLKKSFKLFVKSLSVDSINWFDSLEIGDYQQVIEFYLKDIRFLFPSAWRLRQPPYDCFFGRLISPGSSLFLVTIFPCVFCVSSVHRKKHFAHDYYNLRTFFLRISSLFAALSSPLGCCLVEQKICWKISTSFLWISEFPFLHVYSGIPSFILARNFLIGPGVDALNCLNITL